MSIIRLLYIYLSKDVTIRGKFSKTEEAREQKFWETL